MPKYTELFSVLEFSLSSEKIPTNSSENQKQSTTLNFLGHCLGFLTATEYFLYQCSKQLDLYVISRTKPLQPQDTKY